MQTNLCEGLGAVCDVAGRSGRRGIKRDRAAATVIYVGSGVLNYFEIISTHKVE